jgi:hypothetical protein
MAFTFGDQTFALSFPDLWKDETIYSFKGPEDSGIQHGLLVTIDREPDTDDLARYAEARVNALENTLQGAEFLKQDEKELSSGYPAYEVVYKWVPTEGKVLWQRQVWILAEGAVYNFTASFSKKTFKTIGREVDEIIESFGVGGAPEQAEPEKKFALLGIRRKGKPAVKKPTVKKPSTKKPGVKKPVAKKPPVKKPVAKKPTVKKPKPRGR